jgi:hypothetical protein
VDQVIAALPAGRDISLFETTLFCLLEHLAFRPSVPVAAYENLAAYVARYGTQDAARATSFRFEPAVPSID